MAVALAIAAVVLSEVAMPRPAAGQDSTSQGSERFGIRLVDVPVDRGDDPRARAYVIDHLNPGATIERRVEVSNHTEAALSLSLYVAAASVEEGEFHFGDGRAENTLTTWSTVTPAAVTVAAGERAVATVSVNVPANAGSDEYYGVVWAEARSADATGVASAHRVGVRMYLSVGPGGEPPSDFEIRTLTASRDQEGRPILSATVENTGERALDLSGEASMADGPGGLTAGPFAMDLGTTLAPGATAAATLRLDPTLPDGPWKATVTVRSGTLEKKAQATITFPAEHAQSAAPVPARSVGSNGLDLVRLGLASGIAVFTVGGIVVVLLARRRRLPSRQRRTDPASSGLTAPRPPRVRRPGPGRSGPPPPPPSATDPGPEHRQVASPPDAGRGRRLREPRDLRSPRDR